MEVEAEGRGEFSLTVSQDARLGSGQRPRITVHIDAYRRIALHPLRTVRVQHGDDEERYGLQHLPRPFLVPPLKEKMEDIHQRERCRGFVAVHL